MGVDEVKQALILYGVRQLARQTGGELEGVLCTLGLQAPRDNWWAGYEGLLAGGEPPPEGLPTEPLRSIFSLIHLEGAAPSPVYHRPGPLSLSREALFPCSEYASLDPAKLKALWDRFVAELDRAAISASDARFFELFYHLYYKWAWALPCTYGEPGVSLFQQWKAVAGLVLATGERWAEGPGDEFTLIGGDIPGIQDFVYTITSKGAAKGLRGRSFFIQLLGDAVVRRLLSDLELCPANVIYNAGGNFMVLGPKGEEKTVSEIAARINEQFLEAFEGDVAFCVACHPLPATQVGSAAFSQDASRVLHEALGREKLRRFVDIACRKPEDWRKVFGAQGQGGVRFCAVCQHERRAGEKGRTIEDGWKCEHCAGFEDLAQTIAQDRLLMFVSTERPGQSGQRWQELLWQLTRRWYDFHPGLRKDQRPDVRIYSVNYVDFLAEYTHGFRFIANTTPRKADGQVKTFEDLALGATGLERVGVLRMDVDDLGKVLTHWMPNRTMAATSALSNALDRFFSGWLDAICHEVTDDPQMKGVESKRSDLLYVIYAGGDDLFVVGAWDLMPLLADKIREQFDGYVGRNPHLHISAGITLEDRKFPLYQAAERAGDALDRGAKELTRKVDGQEVKKNAFSFLGLALGWETYAFVKKETERLIWLIQEQKVSRSLLSVLRAIHARYLEDVRQAAERSLTGEKMYYGPWMWRKVYQLSRIRQRYGKQEIVQAIESLETEVLTAENMPYIGLATRWAEYLTRGGRGQ